MRENAGLWKYIKSEQYYGLKNDYKKYGLLKVYKNIKRIFKNHYFLHDTFGVYFNRLIGCKIFGHRTEKFEVCGDKQEYCYKCERYIEEE